MLFVQLFVFCRTLRVWGGGQCLAVLEGHDTLREPNKFVYLMLTLTISCVLCPAGRCVWGGGGGSAWPQYKATT